MFARDLQAALGEVPIRKLTTPALAAIVFTWKDRYAKHTAYALRSRMGQFLRSLEPLGLGLHNLARTLPKLNFPKARRVIATTDELHALYRNAEPWLRLFLMLAGPPLGLRFAEARSIAESNWNPEEHTITFVKKGGDEHTLSTTPEMEQLFLLAPDTGDRNTPFIYRLRGQHRGPDPAGVLTDKSLRLHFSQLRKRAAVNPQLTVHDLRRTALVRAYDQTHDLRLVSHLAGHARLSTTAWYLEHRDTAKLRELVHQLRPITEMKQ
jgi:hypothetical protein